MVQTTSPKNAQQALAVANRFDRAQKLIAEGYRFEKDPNSEVIAVIKPGRLAASYWINMLTPGCDCPDRMKGNICKHEMAWDAICAEEADELAGLEEQCRMYDAEEGRHLDLIPLPTLTKDVVRAMEQDLAKVNTAIAQHGARRTNYITAQQQFQQAGRLENALVIINQYRSLPVCTTCDSELPFCLCTQPDENEVY